MALRLPRASFLVSKANTRQPVGTKCARAPCTLHGKSPTSRFFALRPGSFLVKSQQPCKRNDCSWERGIWLMFAPCLVLVVLGFGWVAHHRHTLSEL